jgi:hypothetical protein
MINKKINKILKKGSSSENDLLEICNYLDIKINFIGSIYDIKNLKDKNYIFLLSPSKKILNGHWTSLYNTKNKSYYFDSQGIPPSQILVDNIKNIEYNPYQIQTINQTYCGLFCCYFLYYMNQSGNKDKHFKNFLNNFIIHNII